MNDQLSCSKCSFTASEIVTRCPECGSWMRRAQGLRRRGWVLIFLGLLLVGMMGTITFLVAPSMLSGGASAGARFTGTPDQAILILGLFGIVIVFGLTCIASGLWQVVTGRRNIWIVVLILGLTFLLIVAGAAVFRALDRGSDRVQFQQYTDTKQFADVVAM
jgi:uncharacterized membrane protein YedE/YeeE